VRKAYPREMTTLGGSFGGVAPYSGAFIHEEMFQKRFSEHNVAGECCARCSWSKCVCVSVKENGMRMPAVEPSGKEEQDIG